MLESDEIMDLRKQAHDLKPTVYVGKGGLTPGIIEEVKAQIRKNHLVKIKLQKSALGEMDTKEAADELLSRVPRSYLVEKKGFCITLYAH